MIKCISPKSLLSFREEKVTHDGILGQKSFKMLNFFRNVTIFSVLLQLSSREKAATNYSQKLKEKFRHHPQIRRISHHRHLPKNIFHDRAEMRIMKEARRRKCVFSVSHSLLGKSKRDFLMVTWTPARNNLT